MKNVSNCSDIWKQKEIFGLDFWDIIAKGTLTHIIPIMFSSL